jgi:MFS family permease
VASATTISTAGDNGRGYGSILALMMALAAANHFNRISMPIAGDERIMAQYGIEPTRMGWIYSSFLIGYTVCMIPGGWVIDRFGARAALAGVGLGSAVFVAMTGMTGWFVRDGLTLFAVLMVVRGLMGAVSAPLHPAGARLVGSWVPIGGRSRANGVITGAALVGIAGTPPLFGALVAWTDWPGAFLLASAATALLSLAWIVLASDAPGERRHTVPVAPFDDRLQCAAEPALSLGSLARDRSLVLLTLSYGAVGYFQYLFFYWMDYYFRKVLALPDSTSRVYAAIPPLAMAVGMPLGGWLADRLERSWSVRWGRRIVPIAGLCAGAVFLVLGIVAREPGWIVACFALALGAVGASEGPYWATAVERGGRRGGSAAGLLNTGGNAGGILAPIVTPWVGERFGWPASVALGSVVCIIGVLLWLGVDPQPRKREG